jgi:predicted 3-demethylubiquinone-9 3-methyltransferase (glyoxalase superfamily)
LRERLSEGGAPGQCGWLTDKFGVSWQIVPSIVTRMMQSADAAVVERVMRAVLPMKKLDVAKLQQAFDGG